MTEFSAARIDLTLKKVKERNKFEQERQGPFKSKEILHYHCPNF